MLIKYAVIDNGIISNFIVLQDDSDVDELSNAMGFQLALYEDSMNIDDKYVPKIVPSLEERVADLEAENETISEVLDALLMGDIEV